MKRLLPVLLATVAGWACAQINIVTTTAMVGDAATAVAGPHAVVRSMMGPGVDPHLYQATPGDIQALQRADIILYSGLDLEGQLGAVLARLGEMKPVLAVAEAIPVADRILSAPEDVGEDGYGLYDPHVWMDADLFGITADAVAALLAEYDPENAGFYVAAAAEYRAQLAALAEWARQAIGSIPEEQRVLVTAHDAFAYYGRAHGIEVAGIQGISTETEASVADITDTVDMIVGYGVPAIFIESTISPRTIQAVLEAAVNAGHQVVVGGELYSDAMGAAGTAEGTLIGMLRHNTITITEALGGIVPPLPAELAAWAAEWDVE